jgi:hypothetical protein
MGMRKINKLHIVMMLKVKSIFLKYRQLIPVIIMTVLLINTFLNAYQIRQLFTNEISGLMVSWKQFLACLFVIINLISFFYFRRYYKYVLALTLIAGLFNFICFTLTQFEYFIGLGQVILKFQTTTLLIILITYLTNLKSANNHIFRFIADLRN